MAELSSAVGTILLQTGVITGLLFIASIRGIGVRRTGAAMIAYTAATWPDKSWHQGGKPSRVARFSRWWNWQARYYAARIVRTAALSPSPLDAGGQPKPYIFAIHPHGVLALSVWVNFCTEATGFGAMFPGVNIRTPVVDPPFYLPLQREVTMGGGGISPAPRSVTAALKKGFSVALAIGGPTEALLPQGTSMKVILEDRLGFVKMALEHGADIVPCLAYGENSVFDQASGVLLRKFQLASKRLINFSPVIFYGRFGLVPKRQPLTMVTGPPLHVDVPMHQKADPAAFNARCVELHCAYMAALQKLHAETHEAFGNEQEHELEILSATSARLALHRGAL
eukprot:NODE_7358_length_1586_cov_10.304318.p1 GENE.NODE_7358_length_1586_cov_10.304318~~NODE_7358_length_1586_cov_10.304318.p1  ORF type:complete len:339 (-),score=84.66 NODE_7358_length_1586_cov_10.304318:483-1499(-)